MKNLAEGDAPFLRVIPADVDHSADHGVVVAWLRDYVSRPHEHLGRAGPVCPFVMPALRAGALQFSFRYDVDGTDIVLLRRTIVAEMLEFEAYLSKGKGANSRDGRLVVMPWTGPDGWRILDAAYIALKDFAVQRGMMIGHFHPDCVERACRNPLFPVSVSPICLLAIRRIAVHDVLFLNSRREWFERYHGMFKEHYARGRVRDPLMEERYREAMERYVCASDGYSADRQNSNPLPAYGTNWTEA